MLISLGKPRQLLANLDLDLERASSFKPISNPLKSRHQSETLGRSLQTMVEQILYKDHSCQH